MARRQDPDLREMTRTELRREVMRLRKRIRWHRDLNENERCWHCDLELYAVLPEEEMPGRMTGPKPILLLNCGRYIDRQQCVRHGCVGPGTMRLRYPTQTLADCLTRYWDAVCLPSNDLAVKLGPLREQLEAQLPTVEQQEAFRQGCCDIEAIIGRSSQV